MKDLKGCIMLFVALETTIDNLSPQNHLHMGYAGVFKIQRVNRQEVCVCWFDISAVSFRNHFLQRSKSLLVPLKRIQLLVRSANAQRQSVASKAISCFGFEPFHDLSSAS